MWTSDSCQTGVSPAQLLEWEARNSAKLPEALKKLLLEHNGGTIGRYCNEWEIYALDEIKLADREWAESMQREDWETVLVETNLKPNVQLFVFSNSDNVFMFFDVSEDGPSHCFYHHIWDDFQMGDNGEFNAWCTQEWPDQLSAEPTVSWSEIGDLDVLADEKCLQNGWVKLHQVIGRSEGQLWFYVHELRERRGVLEWESISKISIPEPLNARQCSIERESGQWRLHLSVSSAGQVFQCTRHRPDAGWFTEPPETSTRGTTIFSSNEEMLLELRQRLLGEDGATLADRRDKRHKKGWGAVIEMAENLRNMTSKPGADPDKTREAILEAANAFLPRFLKKVDRLVSADEARNPSSESEK